MVASTPVTKLKKTLAVPELERTPEQHAVITDHVARALEGVDLIEHEHVPMGIEVSDHEGHARLTALREHGAPLDDAGSIARTCTGDDCSQIALPDAMNGGAYTCPVGHVDAAM